MRPARIALVTLVALGLIGLLAPLIVAITGAPGPNEVDASSLSSAFGTPEGPGSAHWLGVDWLGRDVFSRVIYGTRVSLLVASSAVAGAVSLSVLLGILAGFKGGLIDTVISRMIEAFLVIPYLLLAVGIAATCSSEQGCLNGTVRPGIPLVVVILALTSWPALARIIRNETLVLRGQDFVSAARLTGASDLQIVLRELLPNLMPVIGVMAVILAPQMVMAEAAFSFLGVGVPASTSSWGGMIASAAPFFPESWWLLIFPGLALVIAILACAVLADHFRRNRADTAGWIW